VPVSEAGDQRFGPVASVVNIRTMARSQAQPADGCCTAWITTGLCSPEIAANELTLTGERAKEARRRATAALRPVMVDAGLRGPFPRVPITRRRERSTSSEQLCTNARPMSTLVPKRATRSEFPVRGIESQKRPRRFLWSGGIASAWVEDLIYN